MAQGKASVADWQTVYPEKGYIFGDFIERMWAYLTIQQQLENRLVHGEIFLLPCRNFIDGDFFSVKHYVIHHNKLLTSCPSCPLSLFQCSQY